MKCLAFIALPLLVEMAVASAAAAQSQTKEGSSFVEGKVVHEPGGEPIRKVMVRLMSTDAGAESRAFAEMGDNSDGQAQAEAMEFIASFRDETEDVSQVFRSTTDTEGHFRIEKVPPGKYFVSLSRDGYVPAETKPRQSIITVADGQNVSDLTYKMSTAALIIGKIVDADGDPVVGLAVQAISKSEARSPLTSTLGSFVAGFAGSRALRGICLTNDLGEFRIARLRPGQYLVVARPRGDLVPPLNPDGKAGPPERLLYATTYYPGVVEEKLATPIQVSSGATASVDFTLQAHRAYRVSGIVSGFTGAKGSVILLTSNNGGAIPIQQPLGEGGKFDFPSLEPGKYFAQVLVVPRQGQENPGGLLSISTPIVVAASDLTDLVLQPLPHAKVSGKCRAEGQDAVEWKQVSITLMPVSDSGESSGEKDIFDLERRTGSGPLNDDGTFEISDVTPGKYQVAVASPSEKYRDWYLKSLLFAGQEVADAGFTISGDSSLDLLISPKGAAISGSVVDGAGNPAPNVFVMTLPSSGKLARPDAYQTAKTDANGKFVIRGMNPGDFVAVAVETQQDTRTSEFFQKYANQGTNVTLVESDQKTLTLTLVSDTDKQ